MENTNIVKFFLNDKNAILPNKGTEGSAGYDLYSCESVIIKGRNDDNNDIPIQIVNTGIKYMPPKNIYAEIRDRSSVVRYKGLKVVAGIIDSDYRGEIKIAFENIGKNPVEIKTGEKIAQLIFHIIENINIEEVEDGKLLDTTIRNEGGFGSTGKY